MCDLKEAVEVADSYLANKQLLDKLNKAHKIKIKDLAAEVKTAEKVLLDYCKENKVKVVVGSKALVEVKGRKSTDISLSRLFAYSLSKIRNMKLFLLSVKVQVGTVKKLYDVQALTDKGIWKVVENNYHHLTVDEK